MKDKRFGILEILLSLFPVFTIPFSAHCGGKRGSQPNYKSLLIDLGTRFTLGSLIMQKKTKRLLMTVALFAAILLPVPTALPDSLDHVLKDGTEAEKEILKMNQKELKFEEELRILEFTISQWTNAHNKEMEVIRKSRERAVAERNEKEKLAVCENLDSQLQNENLPNGMTKNEFRKQKVYPAHEAWEKANSKLTKIMDEILQLKKELEVEVNFLEKQFEELEAFTGNKIDRYYFYPDHVRNRIKKLRKALQEIRRNREVMSLELKAAEEDRKSSASLALEAYNFKDAETIIEKMSSRNKIIFEGLLMIAVGSLLEQIDNAINDCRLTRPKKDLPSAQTLINQLPTTLKERVKLQKDLDKAIEREMGPRKGDKAGVKTLYMEARDLWRESTNKYKAANYDDGLVLWRQSLEILKKAHYQSQCDQYKNKIKKVIDKMEQCEDCKKWIKRCKDWRRRYKEVKEKRDKAANENKGYREAKRRMKIYQTSYETNCCNECVGGLNK